MKAFLDYFARSVEALRAGAALPDPAAIAVELAGLAPRLPSHPATRPAPGKLSVALVCREYPPDSAYGGMATFTRRLARGLVDAGHRVAVIAFGTPEARLDFDGRADVIRIAPRPRDQRRSFEALAASGRITLAPAVFYHSLGAYQQLLELERVHGRFDVVDLADYAADGLWPALCWRGPSTVRLYSPSSLLATMRFQGRRAPDADALFVLERALLRACDGITCASRDLAARVRTFFGLDREIDLVPSPVDVAEFSPRPPRRSAQVRVAFVGRLEERKGVHVLLAALPRVLRESPLVEVDLVGRDVAGLAEGIDLGADRHRVRVHGPVPLSDIPLRYRDSDIAVVPSQYDNAPFTCVEAMACGLPVVGTAAGGLAEYIADGDTGLLVPAGDSDALAAAILRLARDPSLRARMGHAARALAERHFDIRRVTALMEDHYRSVMAGAPGRGDAGWSSGRWLDRGSPEANGVELLVVAGPSERALAGLTIESAAAQVDEITVLWEGPGTPDFPGASVHHVGGDAWQSAGMVLSTALQTCVIVVRAGTRLAPGLVDRALCRLAVGGAASVEVEGVRVFLAAAVRGFAYPRGPADWGAIVAHLAGRAATADAAGPPAPIPPYEPRRHGVAAREGAARARMRRAIVWAGSARLRPLVGVALDVAQRLPGGGRLATRLSARARALASAAPRARRRSSGPLVVAVTEAAAHARARREGLTAAELWALEDIVPPAYWPQALCYVLRTRPPATVRLGMDLSPDLVPADYRPLLVTG